MALLPKMNGVSSQRVNIPYLSGGINPGSVGEAVSDNQLTDCNNVWFRGGEVVTRPALQQKNEIIESDFSLKGAKHTEKYIDGVKYKFYIYSLNNKITLLITADNCSVFKKLEKTADNNYNYGSVMIYSGKKKDEFGIGVYIIFKDTDEIYKVNELTVNPDFDFGTDKSLVEEAYIPKIRINGYGNYFSYLPRSEDAATEKTTMIEGFNLLTDAYSASYTTDNISTRFRLPHLPKSKVKVVVDTNGMIINKGFSFGYASNDEIVPVTVDGNFYGYDLKTQAVSGIYTKLEFNIPKNSNLSDEAYLVNGTMIYYDNEGKEKYNLTYYRTVIRAKIDRVTGDVSFVAIKRDNNNVYVYSDTLKSTDELGFEINHAQPTNSIIAKKVIGNSESDITLNTSLGSILYIKNYDFSKNTIENAYIKFGDKTYIPYIEMNTNDNAEFVFSNNSKGSLNNNLVVTVYNETSSEIKKIISAKITTNYGGNIGLDNGIRTVVTNGNTVYLSDIDNPLYFPENCFFAVGDNAPITALSQQQGYLVIFKEHSMFYTYETEVTTSDNSSDVKTALENQTIIDLTAQYKYAIYSLSSEIGCNAPDTVRLCMNRLIWANSDGNVYTLASLSQFSERNIFCVSGLIKDKLRQYNKTTSSTATAVDWQGFYLLFINKTVFVLDYNKNAYKYIGSYTSDSSVRKYGLFSWWVWTLPVSVYGAIATDENVSLITKEFMQGIYKNFKLDIDNPETDTESMIQSKFFDFSIPDFYKSIDRLQIEVGNDHDNTIFIELLTDGGTIQKIPIEISSTGKRGTASYQREKVIYPLIRNCRKFGFKITATGAFSLGSANINYTTKGRVLNGKA